jgi:ribonucleotide monophosphatase NagD (HAD superfamily)
VVLLSNSSKRRRDALKNLEVKMGLGPPGPDGLYLDVITSGEVTHALVTAGRAGHPAIVPGSKVFVCGSGDGDGDYVAGLGCDLAGPRDADWVLARGNFVLVAKQHQVAVPAGAQADHFAAQTAFYASVDSGLGVCRARGLPMLVANPDTLRPGTNSPMPGTIGALYATGRLDAGNGLAAGQKDSIGQIAEGSSGSGGQQRLGTVLYVGKPHAAVYAEAFRALAASDPGFDVALALREGRVCAVGDALATDVKGGGWHLGRSGGRVLVAHGVHAQELGVPEGQGWPPAKEAVAAFLAAELGHELGGRLDTDVPTHVVPAFVW